MSKYDKAEVARLREEGKTWDEVAELVGATTGNTLQKWFSRQDTLEVDPEEQMIDDGSHVTALLTADDVARIRSVEDLIAFFKVDMNLWEIERFKVNKWEQHSVAKGVVPLYQVLANLVPNHTRMAERTAALLEDVKADMLTHAPVYPPMPPKRERVPDAGDPCLAVVAIMDPHLGMLAWEQETPNNYDLNHAMRDYTAANRALLRYCQFYAVDRIVLLVGNDLLHIDTMIQGKIGSTTAGTPQDFDTRYPKIFTSARRVVVAAIDEARSYGVPVDVIMVEGNHDRASTYTLGEVLSAWYRNCEGVTIDARPTTRKYYQYGNNLLGLTHGEEFNRKRDPLPLIMATEAKAMWADTDHREWLTGHFHSKAEKFYMAPRTDIQEEQGVRVRSLPGLTGWDKWHTDSGYRHHRAATALFYRHAGGTVGVHEFTP